MPTRHRPRRRPRPADARQEIIRVLTNPSLYFPQGTNAVRAEVDAFCQEVQTSYYEKLAGE